MNNNLELKMLFVYFESIKFVIINCHRGDFISEQFDWRRRPLVNFHDIHTHAVEITLWYMVFSPTWYIS